MDIFRIYTGMDQAELIFAKNVLQESRNILIFEPSNAIDSFIFRFWLNNASIRRLTCFTVCFQQGANHFQQIIGMVWQILYKIFSFRYFWK